jgi:hypothetical protein
MDIIKKRKFCLLIIFFFCSYSFAQPFKKNDTLVVFKALPVPGTVTKYFPFKKGNKISWVDRNDSLHKSTISKITANYLVVNKDTIFPVDIKSVFISGPLCFMPYQTQNMSISLESDTIRRFNVMSYLEFEKLTKTEVIIKAKENNDPFYKHVSAEKYAADMDKKIQRRKKMLADLDTCPLHYGIKTNLVRDLTNEINIYFELPLKRNFCIDVGAGVLYAKPDANRYDFASVVSDLNQIRNRNLFWFDHSYINRRGFTFEIISKFFLTRKKHLYLGPQLGFKYYHYNDKWIWLNADGSDYYHISFYAFQSEKSAAVNLNAIFGVQTPQIKKFLFDAFFSKGMTYRGGVVNRKIDKAYYHEWTTTDYYDPPEEIKGGGVELSVQMGFRIGWRFAKAKHIK